MRWLLNSREMKQADATTMQHFGIPSMVLMERAALGVVDCMEHMDIAFGKVGIVCGSGNNGGDGFAIARLLFLKGYDVCICFVGEETKCTEDCLRQKHICEQYQIPYTTDWKQLKDRDTVLDAIFGIGLQRDITGNFFDVISYVNTLNAIKIAVDIPSGVSADDGKILGVGFQADVTITFGFAKVGQKIFPGRNYCGMLQVVDIGVSEQSLKDTNPQFRYLDVEDLEELPKTAMDANKGSVGKVLLIAGSDEIAGAAFLAAYSALSCGCGMVKVYTTEKNRDVLMTKLPEALVVCYDKYNEKQVLELMQWADAIAVGPGIGQSKTAVQLVSHVITYATVPLVIDADALNIIAKQPNLLKQPHTEIVVTPHIAEMARLTDNSNLYVLDHKLALAQEFAKDYQVICVLKDAATITAFPYNGGVINDSGTPGMASAGSGDVLTGLLVSLIAQGVAPATAVPLGVYLHGLSGEVAAMENSVHGMCASDIVDGMKRIFKERGL